MVTFRLKFCRESHTTFLESVNSFRLNSEEGLEAAGQKVKEAVLLRRALLKDIIMNVVLEKGYRGGRDV